MPLPTGPIIFPGLKTVRTAINGLARYKGIQHTGIVNNRKTIVFSVVEVELRLQTELNITPIEASYNTVYDQN